MLLTKKVSELENKLNNAIQKGDHDLELLQCIMSQNIESLRESSSKEIIQLEDKMRAKNRELEALISSIFMSKEIDRLNRENEELKRSSTGKQED